MTTIPLAAPRMRAPAHQPRPATLVLIGRILLPWLKVAAARLGVGVGVVRQLLLTLTGLGLLDYGVWHGAGMAWGLVASGVSVLLVEYALKS